MELQLSNLLPQKACDVLYEAVSGITVNQQDDKYYADIEWWSMYDGDQIFTIWFDFDSEEEDVEIAKLYALSSFIDGLEDVYDDFDVDEYVELWLGNRNKCPLSARQLVEDGEDVDKHLKSLLDSLKKL